MGGMIKDAMIPAAAQTSMTAPGTCGLSSHIPRRHRLRRSCACRAEEPQSSGALCRHSPSREAGDGRRWSGTRDRRRPSGTPWAWPWPRAREPRWSIERPASGAADCPPRVHQPRNRRHKLWRPIRTKTGLWPWPCPWYFLTPAIALIIPKGCHDGGADSAGRGS